jgi:hypothetical protein
MSSLESLHRSSGDHRIVWEVLYAYDYQHFVRDDYGDDRFSHYTREQEVLHIVAPTLDAAKLSFAHHRAARCGYEPVSFTPLCTLDHEVSL